MHAVIYFKPVSLVIAQYKSMNYNFVCMIVSDDSHSETAIEPDFCVFSPAVSSSPGFVGLIVKSSSWWAKFIFVNDRWIGYFKR